MSGLCITRRKLYFNDIDVDRRCPSYYHPITYYYLNFDNFDSFVDDKFDPALRDSHSQCASRSGSYWIPRIEYKVSTAPFLPNLQDSRTDESRSLLYSAILSWFKTNLATDSTNGNSWCGYPVCLYSLSLVSSRELTVLSPLRDPFFLNFTLSRLDSTPTKCLVLRPPLERCWQTSTGTTKQRQKLIVVSKLW